jgi:DNA recombination protein RmuC
MGLDMQTKNLLNILNNDRDRGSWTEFKIKDLLDSKGFQEDVHYQYNKQNEQGKRPDFVFKLPDNKKVNLDAKFPWDGYKRIIAKAEELKDINLSQDERENKQKELKVLERNFINTSIKEKINTTSTRDGYIDPKNDNHNAFIIYIVFTIRF